MVKAILLAAGEGIRLKPITETRPKSMIPVLCKPLLEWHLSTLLEIGVEKVIIVTWYMREYIERYLNSRPWISSRVETIDQGGVFGTGDAVIKACERIGYGEDVLITYSDLFLGDWSIYSHLIKQDKYMVVGVEFHDPRDYGILYTREGKLIRVVEKPREIVEGLVNAGIYKLNTSDILENRDIPLSPRGEIEFTDVLNKITSEREIEVYVYRDEWIDVGKPWHVIEANKIAIRKNIKTSVIKGRIIEPVSVNGLIYLGEESTIYPYTVVEGPVYIGNRVEIGPHAYIRPWSVICDYSKIGFSVEVKESVLFENTHAHHLTYIGDSVICENTSLGAGTMIANLRLDGKNVKMNIKNNIEDTGRRKLGAIIGADVKTGVNVSIMPGVKIGSGAWILPGTVVYRDVENRVIYPPKT